MIKGVMFTNYDATDVRRLQGTYMLYYQTQSCSCTYAVQDFVAAGSRFTR